MKRIDENGWDEILSCSEGAEAMTFKTATVAVSVYRVGESPIFGESSTTVSIEDEGAGAFLVITQNAHQTDCGKVVVVLEELRAIVAVAEKIMAEYPHE